MKTVNGKRTLFKESQALATLPLKSALTDLLTFLKESATASASNTSKPVCTVLAGHNAFSFDIPILLRNCNPPLRISREFK